jgi:hypothetical protein
MCGFLNITHRNTCCRHVHIRLCMCGFLNITHRNTCCRHVHARSWMCGCLNITRRNMCCWHVHVRSLFIGRNMNNRCMLLKLKYKISLMFLTQTSIYIYMCAVIKCMRSCPIVLYFSCIHILYITDINTRVEKIADH